MNGGSGGGGLLLFSGVIYGVFCKSTTDQRREDFLAPENRRQSKPVEVENTTKKYAAEPY